MKIAFFDFDGTLTRHDTFIRFAKFSVGKMAFYKALIKSIPVICLWKLGLKSNSDAKQTLFSHLYKGMDYGWFKKLGYAFAPMIDNDSRPEIIEILKQHQRDGRKIIIVSASIADWIKPWAESYGIECVIGTEVEKDKHGRITGRFKTKNCHGAEKVSRIRELYPEIDTFETWAYGDSSGDDAMLSIVNHPNRV
ncbi:MAG: haloacid dehalogenase-like hydrolase [Muribaculaceae bacterium]|nr:haloacid dehalogenase-like hydrolase [Muribaculaceae bacterium]